MEAVRLSPEQRRIYGLFEGEKNQPVNQLRVDCDTEFDTASANDRLSALVQSAEILRTVIAPMVGLKDPVQIQSEFETPYLQLENIGSASLEDRLRGYREAIDLASKPWSVNAVLSDDQLVVVVTAHCLMLDVPSLRIMADHVLGSKVITFGNDDLQFADVSEWLNELADEADLQETRQFWEAALREFDACPDPDIGITSEHENSDSDWRQTGRVVLQKNAATGPLGDMKSLIRAAWVVLLARSSQADRIRLVESFDGRQQEETANVLGSLCQRTPCIFNVDLTQNLSSSARALAEHFSLQSDSPETVPTSGFSGEARVGYLYVTEWNVNECLISSRIPGTQVNLRAFEGDSRICLDLEYNASVLSSQNAQLFLERLATFLDAWIAKPSQSASSVNLLSPSEDLLLERYLCGSEINLSDQTVVHEFVNIAAQAAGKPAVSCGDDTLTYGELKSRSAAIQTQLDRLTDSDGHIVVIGRRSIGFVAAALAVSASGRAYVPVDSSYPAERIAFIVDDSDAAAVIHDGSIDADSLPHVPTVEIDHVGVPIDGQRELVDELQVRATPETGAYVIYTSGSTGHPKGVLIDQANLSYSTAARHAEYDEPVHAFLMPSSFSFDSSVAGLYWTLTSGGLLVIPSDGEEADAQALGKLIGKHKVSHTLMLASLYDAMLQVSAIKDLQSLKAAIVAGEECSPSVAKRHFESIPEAGLFNEYGPTEATVWCTVQQLDDSDTDRLPIGHPIPGTNLKILNDNMVPTPYGAIGELYVCSPGVAGGYWRRPGLTRDKFQNIESTDGQSNLVYKTGDLVRLDQAGRLEFHGRVDRQVKIRGHRIELEEIENSIESLEFVVLTAVSVDSSSGNIIAYVVSNDRTVEASELLANIEPTLPKHFVPASIRFVDEMPKLPNGKIDYDKLPDEAAESEAKAVEFEAPRDKTEEVVSLVFSEVLGVDGTIGIHENFFEIGGHSILATIAVAKLREIFAIELPIRKLFDNPTVSELSSALRELTDESGHPDSSSGNAPVEILRREDQSTGQLSPMQAGIWYLCQVNPNSVAYNLPAAFRVHGNLDIHALESSINLVANSHEVLRSRIVTDADGLPGAIVATSVEVPFESVDLASGAEAEFLEQIAGRPIATDSAPLLRAAVGQIENNEYVVAVVFHHMIAEGWSVGQFLRSVATTYDALCSGTEPSVRPELINYWDWNATQNLKLRSESIESQLAYWRDRLDGPPTPLGFSSQRDDEPRAGMVGRVIPPELAGALDTYARSQSVSLFSVLISAFQVLLHRYTSKRDIRVGTPINTRTLQDLENTFGLFINTLVIRSEIEPASPVGQFVVDAHDTVLDAFSNMDAPLDQVSRTLNEASGGEGREMFEVMFALQNAPAIEFDLKGLSTSIVAHDKLHSGEAKVALSLVIEPTEDGYESWIEFDGTTFSRNHAADFLIHYETLLQSITSDSSIAISELEIFAESQSRRLLEEMNSYFEDFDRTPLVRRFFDVVDESPSGLAVSRGEVDTSYESLAALSRKIVTALRESDITPGDAVATCCERSEVLIATHIACHIAGAHYVPIDPDYPDERIAYIVSDSSAAALVTDQPNRFSLTAPTVLDTAKIVDFDPVDMTAIRWPKESDIAYIVYTSGSTGRPKGVRITQLGLSSLASWESRTYNVSTDDRMTMIAGLGFDASVWEVWPCLVAGASLHIIGDDIRSNVSEIYRWLEEKRITISFLPTPLAEILLDLPVPESIVLRYLFTGGDALHARDWDDLPFDLVNHYGPSENTVVATAGIVESTMPAERAPDIGRPIENTACYILDESLSLLPLGAVGELCLAGPQVADGYQNLASETQERFVENPFGEGDWSSLYRTGDRAFFQNDGRLVFLGRKDSQVKVRGFRIELGEIESVLSQVDGISQSAAKLWDVGRDDRRIVAYLVPSETADEVDVVSLRKTLRAQLPSYMVPTHFEIIDEMPLTANGKVDRESLPLPSTASQLKRVDESLSETESRLADIWSNVLGHNNIGRNSNFFEVGGNSISAMKVVSLISARFGVSVALRSLVLDSLQQIANTCELDGTTKDTPSTKSIGNKLASFWRQR